MAARNFVNGVGISLCRRMSFSITFDEWVQCSDLRLVLGTNGIVPGLASWEGVMILILLTMPHITKICENAWCILVRKLQSTTNTEKTGTTQRRNSLVTIRSGVSPIFSRVFKRWPSSLESHPLFTLSSISASQSLLTTRIYPTVVPNKGRPKGAWKRKRERDRERERGSESESESDVWKETVRLTRVSQNAAFSWHGCIHWLEGLQHSVSGCALEGIDLKRLPKFHYDPMCTWCSQWSQWSQDPKICCWQETNCRPCRPLLQGHRRRRCRRRIWKIQLGLGDTLRLAANDLSVIES